MRGRILDGAESYRLRPHHLIISFDPKDLRIEDLKDKDEYVRLRKRVYEILRFAGAQGGCIVFHPWREDPFNEYTEEGPHFHCIVLARWIKPGDEVYDEFINYYGDLEPILKRIDSFKPSVLKTYKYLLEHSGIAEGIHAVTWFGSMAYNKQKVGVREIHAKKDPRGPECPICGGEVESMFDIYGYCKGDGLEIKDKVM
jgi:hypothetical protein